jgi:hypothetical protein
MDTRGNIYRTRSFVNRDIFVYERELMESAYYASKIPIYLEGIKDGSRIMADTYEIWKYMMEDMEEYGITEVCAHNARFDYNSLNTLKRWTTKSKFRYWFPYGTEIWDSMKMARSVIHNMPTYRKFCEEHGLLTANGRLSTTAENLYRFIIKDPYFEESHTGLEDVMIEAQIVAYCYRQHKEMRKKLFTKELPEMTPFQLAVFMGVRNNPMI